MNKRYEIISPLRTLLLQKRNPNKWQQVLDMDAQMNLRGPKTYTYQYLEEKVVSFLIENYLCKLDEGTLPECSKDIIHKICGVFEVNALEVCIGEKMDLLALYKNTCTMEHNCLPNTFHHFDSEYRITVRAAKKISKNDHLSTIYTNILWSTHARREHLKETKYFDCKCKRCRDPTELGTYISALKCHGDNEVPCNDWQLPVDPLDYNSEWKCRVCSVTLSMEEAKSLDAMLEEEVESVRTQKNISVDKVLGTLSTLEKFLHSHHRHCYETKHLLIQLYGNKPGFSHQQMSNSHLNQKIDICRELLSISDTLDPGRGHLTLYTAVLMFELQGALLEVNSRLQIDDTSEIEKLLNDTMIILKQEPSNSPGSDLRLLVEKSLTKIHLKI